MQPLSFIKYTRQEDVSPDPRKERRSLRLDSLLGAWTNTNPSGSGIAKLIVSQDDHGPKVQIFGTGDPLPVDWGPAPINCVYAKAVDSSEPMAFDARYDLGFMDVQVQGNFSLGLMVLACFNTFKDGSSRANYFSREFFHPEQSKP